MNTDTFKICPECKKNLSFSDFGRDKTKKDGLQVKCKKCKNIYHSNWKKTNQKSNQLKRISRQMREIYNLIPQYSTAAAIRPHVKLSILRKVPEKLRRLHKAKLIEQIDLPSKHYRGRWRVLSPLEKPLSPTLDNPIITLGEVKEIIKKEYEFEGNKYPTEIDAYKNGLISARKRINELQEEKARLKTSFEEVIENLRKQHQEELHKLKEEQIKEIENLMPKEAAPQPSLTKYERIKKVLNQIEQRYAGID